ncbi:MAG: hypothetical protein BA865_12395 [Desulfobacterales bacterium S5133MH4]|nr:MAG: hypothetical protein BA865_12395 [Desulfobacterales bacterium S5133MH4]
MLKKSIFVFVLMLIWPAVCIADLTGKWSCDDGGTYYLRQIGNTLYWYGERDKTKPGWSNVLTGRIKGGEIRGNWADVPKGRTMSSGNLHLAIKQGGNVLVAIKKTGGFGGSRWTRVGYQLTIAVSGHITGLKQFAKRVSIYGPHDFTKLHSSTTIDANGNYRFMKLPTGKYRVVPQAGGKFSLISIPRSREVTCRGGDITNVNFDIKGIEEG